MHLIYGTHILGRPVSAPPGIPADRAKALQGAFNAMVKDKAFLSDAEKLHLPINPWTAEQMTKVINQFASYPDAVYARAIKALEVGQVIKVKLKKLDGSIAQIKKRDVTVTGANGKAVTVKVHPKRTNVTVGGKKSSIKALKAGMTCSFEYFGAGDLAPKATCS
jgi:hypothetical protein